MSTDCQTCKPEPQRPYVGIGTPIEMPGVRHRADCPLVPHLSPEAAERLREGLAEIAAARRRAYVESQFYVLGGT